MQGEKESRPGFFRGFSSKPKTTTERVSPNRRRSISVGSAGTEIGRSKIMDRSTEIARDSKSSPNLGPETTAALTTQRNENDKDRSSPSVDRVDLPETPVGRWYFHARAIALRNLAAIGFGLQHRADPPAPMPTRTIWINSTLSTWSGPRKIQLDIWIPQNDSTSASKPARPCVFVFHGGGFVLGAGTDDARWAGAVVEHLGAVVVAVNYRLAPGYPFPTAVEDCADGILYMVNRTSEYGIDLDKMVISGFSAGGNLAFAAYYLLTHPGRWNYTHQTKVPKFRGIVTFYPLLDFTMARKDKKARCSRPDFCLPDSMTSLFDQSYLHPPPGRSNPLISPGLAPDELVRDLPPIHLCVCEWDMLNHEAKVFRDRLQGLDKEVVWREVKEEKHGWDKPPPLTPKESVREEYLAAVESMRRWLEPVSQTAEATTSAETGRIGVE